MRHFHLAHGRGLYALTGRYDAGYATCERCGAHHALDADAVARVAAVAARGVRLRGTPVPLPDRRHLPGVRPCTFLTDS